MSAVIISPVSHIIDVMVAIELDFVLTPVRSQVVVVQVQMQMLRSYSKLQCNCVTEECD